MKYIIAIAYTLGIIISMTSCGADGLPKGYEGYTEIDNGIYYKFYNDAINNDNERDKLQNGDLIVFHSSIYNGELLISSTYQLGDTEQRIVTDAPTNVPLDRVLPLAKVGDSVSVMIAIDSLGMLPSGFAAGDWMDAQLKIVKIISKAERENLAKASLEGLNQHPEQPFYWKKHRTGGGAARLPQLSDEVKFYFTLRKGNEISYQTTPNQPDVINLPTQSSYVSPLHMVMMQMAVGDSVTAAFEVNRLTESMKLPMTSSGFFDGDVLLMDIGMLRIRDTATVKAEQRKMEQRLEQKRQKTIQRGKTIQKQTLARIEAYKNDQLADNQINKTESGLKYIIHEKGKGQLAEAGQMITVHYMGFTTNQSDQFDTSFDDGEPISFVVGKGEVILGWDEALTLLPVGTKATLFIPYHLAYGEQGRGDVIPPYANLTFYVEIIAAK